MISEKLKAVFEKNCGILGRGYLKVCSQKIGKDVDTLAAGDVPQILAVAERSLANLLERSKLDHLIAELKAV